MSRIYLVRHGEVEGNSGAHRTFAGWADKPLTARGEAQARAIAARLARETIGLVYSSDLQRARRTAESIAAAHNTAEHGAAGHRLDVRVEPALREVNYGAWEGLSEGEIEREYALDWRARLENPETNAPTRGESLGDLWQRLEPAWQNLVEAAESTPQRSAVLVAHNGTIRVLLCALLGIPIRYFRRIHCDNCGLCVVERKTGTCASPLQSNPRQASAPGAWTVMCINETAHLEGV